jgi:hypothetical protein
MRLISLSEGRLLEGDCLPLDISSKSPLWGLRRDRPSPASDKKAPCWGLSRHVWAAALVVIIMVWGGEPQNLIAFSSGDKEQETEISVPLDFKNILIGHLTPQMKPFCAFSNLSQFRPGENPIKNYPMEFILPWANSGHASWRQPEWSKCIIEIRCDRWGNKINLGQNLDITRWGAAVIYDIGSELKPRLIFSALSETFPRFYRNVRPQLAFGRFASATGLRQNNEDQEKIGDENSRSYRIIDDLINDRHKRAGISYFMGILSGAIGIAFYLKSSRLLGGGLVALGLLTPLLPWWLPILNWWANQ